MIEQQTFEQQTFEQSGRPTILAAIGSFSVFDFLTELNWL